MCKYCKHLNELRKKDLENFKSLKSQFDNCLSRYERLLMLSLLVMKSDTDLVNDILKELEREVI